MYEFTQDPGHRYNENPQVNPLRWQIFFREGDVFHPQTIRFMCKDYFNDVVAKYYDWKVIAYGLNNTNMKLNDDGCWVVLTGIMDMDFFTINLENTINKENPEHPLTYEVLDGKLLVFIPRYYFTNTYLISLLSYVIRVSNCVVTFKDLITLLESDHGQADRSLYINGRLLAKAWKFSVPENYQKYWLFYGPAMNNLDGIESLGHGSTIHNCGASAWAEGIPPNEFKAMVKK